MLIAQILIALVITSIISTAFIKNSLNQDDLAEQTIYELRAIAEAAQQYKINESLWPAQDEDTLACSNYSSATFNALGALVGNIDFFTPFSKEGTLEYYRFSCDANEFNIEVKTTDLYAGYIAHKLEIPTVLKAGTTDTTITNVLSPLEDTLHDIFLALGDTTATLNIYQADGNTIDNVADVILTDGRRLSNGILNSYTIDMNADPPELVPIPNCLLSGQTPKVHLANGPGLTASNNKAIYGHLLYIDTAGSNTDNWAVTLDVYTEDGITAAGTNTFIVAMTYCE